MSMIVVGLLFGVASAVSACTSGGSILGTRESACFRVLPSARTAVGTAPKFAGVRHLAPGVLLEDLRRHHQASAATVPAALEANRGAACLVAFLGRFTPKDVRQAWAPHAGPYHVAIVIVDEANERVLSTVLLHATPLDFTHKFLFDR
jgi:hypothetical protein